MLLPIEVLSFVLLRAAPRGPRAVCFTKAGLGPGKAFPYLAWVARAACFLEVNMKSIKHPTLRLKREEKWNSS